MVYLTRRERFNAAHRMFQPHWSNEKNLEVYGKCSNPNWHGHEYILFVTVKGEINPEIGYAVNLKQLSKVMKEHVVEKIDHKNINLEVDFMQGKVATTENLAVAVWEVLEPEIRKLSVELHCVKIQETENNYIEYYGG
jgi:6-pyruvoyltetrahydropterin/6-carboxytetrahydropterin synthase